MTYIFIIFAPESALLNKLFKGRFNHVCQIALCASFEKHQNFDVYELPDSLRVDPMTDIAFVYDGESIQNGTRKVLEQCIDGKDLVYVSYHKSTLEEYGHRRHIRSICKEADKYFGKNLFEIEMHHNSGLIYDATKILANAQTNDEYKKALDAFLQAFPNQPLDTILNYLHRFVYHQGSLPELPKKLTILQSIYEVFRKECLVNYKNAFTKFRDSVLAFYVEKKSIRK